MATQTVPFRDIEDLSNEEALVASIIIDGSAADSLQISRGDFTDVDLGKLFDLVMAMHAAGEPTTDMAHLKASIRSAGINIDGARLGQILVNSGFQAANAKHYAATQRKISTDRKLIAECLRTVEDVNRGADSAAKIGELRAVLDALESRKSITIRSAVEIAKESILGKQAKRSAAVFTGLESFDRNFGGFAGGDLVILAARTSVGKSALSLQIAEHNARKGRSVLYVSIEMRDHELIDRILSRISGCTLAQMRNGSLKRDDYQLLNDAAFDLNDLPFFVHDRPTINVAGIRAAARLTQARNGLALLVVDYINRVKPDDSRRERHEQLGQISRDLKTLAKELDVPILALAQLNRQAEYKGGEPSLIHLKESGALEEDADAVMILHRENIKAIDTRLILAKNRHGETDAIELEFIGHEIRFRCKSSD